MLNSLELACGLAIGSQPDVPPLPPPDERPARMVLEDVVRESLERPPCFVSFSGGRDSSAVLATTVHVARRDGLPLPVPVSLRFPGVASTEESSWQELVVAHLGLDEWVRIDITDELDLLGDIATTALRNHGLLWPHNAYFHVPMLRVAKRGRLLTGVDGDGLFGLWRWSRAQSVLARRVRPTPRDVPRVAVALAPTRLRALARSRFELPPVTWLRPPADRELTAAWRRDAAGEPRRWDDRVRWYARRRYLHLGRESLAVLAADEGAGIEHPLVDPRFLAALARDGGATGWGNRTATMRVLFGDVLPAASVERPRKAEFGRALWRARARAFAADWDGTGVDRRLVDADKLRAVWAMDNPWFAATALLHHAWLATAADLGS